MKKIAYTALAGLLICGALSGCAQQTNGEEVKEAKTWEYARPTQIVYDCLGGTNDIMPILGYWSAPSEAMLNGQYYPDMRNDEYFAAVQESGVNLLVNTNDNTQYYEVDVESILDYCDEYGLGYYVSDFDYFGVGTAGAFVGDYEKLKESMKNYARHESFAGFYLSDEPRPLGVESSVNASLKVHYEASNELGLNVHPYLNLNPYWASWYQPDPYEKYRTHIDGIYDDSEMSYIMYDVYPLEASGFNYEWFYSNLSIVKNAADDKNISWIPFVETSGDEGMMPDEGELSWQVNQFLAFGAKGISYFPINAPLSFSSAVEAGKEVAMFDFLGNKTAVYYYVKEVNKQILAVDEYLMNATNHGVVVNGELIGSEYLRYGEILEDGKFRELTGVSGDHATVGCFDYYGKTCLYAVNGSMYENASVTLKFDDRYAYDVIQRGQTAGVKGRKIELSLAAGEAAFIILK